MRNKNNIVKYLERIEVELQKIRSNNSRGDRREVDESVEKVKTYLTQVQTFLNQES